jgi:hypothetical protein
MYSNDAFSKRRKIRFDLTNEERARECQKDAKSDGQIPGKQTLESLNPGLLEPFLPTNWEKIQK